MKALDIKNMFVVLSMILIAASVVSGAEDKLEQEFRNPPNTARPRAYWNWLNGDVTLDGLTRDLEEAKSKGVGGLEMWDTEAMRNPGGFVPAGPPFMGPESVAAMHHAMKEARRLELDLGLVTSSGWNAGGPWVPPALASKNLFPTQIVVSGPGRIVQKIPFPKVPYYCPKGKDGLPKWSMEVAVLAWPDSKDKVVSDLSDVIDLSSKFKDGVLTWTAPAGEWRVIRYVCSNNGQQLIAASPNSKGPFIDFLDPEATRFHFEYIIGKLGLKKGGDPSPLKYLEVDSMELHHGIQWTPKFPDWFKRYHSYDPVRWLPVLSGLMVKDKETSQRFVYDYKKTVSDLLIFSHYATGSEVCAEYGLELAGEAGGPGPPIWNTCPVDALKALGNVAIPRGEFWIKHRNMFLIKEIASAAHIYGKPYVDAESRTTWRRWMDNLFVRKQIVDRAFCEGLNRITYHGYSHSPVEVVYPGRTYHAGVDMNPQVVWWSKVRPFMDYLARCCYMLQQGKFVADVAHFYGDQAPNFWPLYHNVPKKPLLDGLGAGYDYDVVNSDVILNRMSVRDGRIVLPDGMSYRVLTLPQQRHMPLKVLEKLEKLVAKGATIIGPKPLDTPGLQVFEARTKKLRAIADKMWGACDGKTVKKVSYGKGDIVWGLTAREWLNQEGVGPDFSYPEAQSVPVKKYWIWYPEDSSPKNAPGGAARCFKRIINIDKRKALHSASALITADNAFTLWVNGKQAGSGNNWQEVKELQIGSLLQSGENVLAIRAENHGASINPAGVIALFKLNYRDGRKDVITTDGAWQVSDRESEGWNTDAMPLEGGKAARVLGEHSMPPWGSIHALLGTPTPLDYIHRRTEKQDIYFVRNRSLSPVSADCLFRVKNKTPYFWDPADGSIKPAFFYGRAGDQTSVRLDLAPGGSVFVVFGKKTGANSVVSLARTGANSDDTLPPVKIVALKIRSVSMQCFQNGEYTLTDNKGRETQVRVDNLPAPRTVEGEWTVTFDPKWGAPPQIKLPNLISWSDHEDEGVKYYSGSGFYTRTLDVPADWLADGGRIHLDLGDVRDVAEVFVNGKSAGILWKPPLRVDVTSLVKPGVNALKIEVMNMWINRLSGDAKLPAEKKFCRSNIQLNAQHTSLIQPAGLLGPVRLLPSVEIMVGWAHK